MTPAQLSVVALVVVMAASFGTRVNVGVLAIGLAWGVAVIGAGWSAEQVLRAFPSGLLVTLLGVSLLFGAMQANGTLGAVTLRALRACRGRAAWLPALLFGLAGVVSAMGPGAIASVALLAPVGMVAGHRAGVPPLLSALMIGNGANAGNLTPFSATGVIMASGLERAGVAGLEWSACAANFVAHALVAALAWLAFGGRRLQRENRRVAIEDVPAFTRAHVATLVVGALWVLAVVWGGVHLGLAACVAVAVLVGLLRAADDTRTFTLVPWPVIVMVCGVSTLVGVLEGTGGLDLFSAALATVATPSSVNGVIAFITGAISTYSSTSGVVYPTFLPTVPGLVAQLGGGDAREIALSIGVGAALVDVSPLSTIGALCLAALPDQSAHRTLFRQLLAWGVAMTVVGALFCQLAIGLFVRS